MLAPLMEKVSILVNLNVSVQSVSIDLLRSAFFSEADLLLSGDARQTQKKSVRFAGGETIPNEQQIVKSEVNKEPKESVLTVEEKANVDAHSAQEKGTCIKE